MRLLITGGSGFIGSHLVEALLERGHHVLNLDWLTYAARPASLDSWKGHSRYDFRPFDVADTSRVREALAEFRPDAIFHLAAESHVDRSIDSPDPFIHTNIHGTFSLLEAIRSCRGPSTQGPRLIHISTDEVFGSLAEDGSFPETSPYAPRSPYSASKAAADHLVRSWGETFGLPVTVVHPTNTYGPRQLPEKLIPRVILRALHGHSIPVYGDGRHRRDWVFVGDLVAGLLAVLDRGKTGQSYNLGGGGSVSNLWVVHHLCDLLDRLHPGRSGTSYRDQIAFVADRPAHDLNYQLDISKAACELDWQPQTSLEGGLEATLAWYLEHPQWWGTLLDDPTFLERQGR